MIQLPTNRISHSAVGVSTPTSGRVEIDHLIVLGMSPIVRRNAEFFVKTAIGHYLEELSCYFPKLTYVAGKSRDQYYSKDQYYSRPLQTARIVPIQWDFKLGLRSYIDLLRELMGLRHSRIAVLLQVPQTRILPLVPFFRFYARRFIAYVAGDWIEINRELRKRGKAWRVPLDNTAAVLPIRWADSVLVRGPELLRKVRPYNANVVESPPIVAWQRSRMLRTDTCQGECVSLLYVGKLLVSKGLDVLFEALLHLRANRPALADRLRLSILGTGEDESILKNKVRDMGLDSKVEFWGYVDDPEVLSRVYSHADILIVPSKDSEGLPRVVEEGLLHGLPVIATKVGGTPLAYRDGEELLIVPPGNAKALAEAIEDIEGNKMLRQRLVLNGSRRVQMRYSGHTAAWQHAEVILGRSVVPVDSASNCMSRLSQ